MSAPTFAVTSGTLDATAVAGGFLVTETTHPARFRLPRHAHEHAGLTLVLDGAFDETFARHRVECRRGGLLVKPAGAPHTNAYGPRGARSLLVTPRALGDEQARLAARGCDRVSYLAGGVPNQLGLAVARELRTPDAASPLAIEGLLLELLAALVRGASGSDAHEPPWLRVAVDYLDAHARSPVRLGDVARAAGVPEVRLARAFRRHRGLSIGAYQRALRVDWARAELVRTARPIAEIAAEAGFTDQSHFTRVFARAVGTTPARYRGSAR